MDREEARFLAEAAKGAQAWRRRRGACIAVVAAGTVAGLAAGAIALAGDLRAWGLAAACFGVAGAFAVEAAYCHTLAGAALHLRHP